MKEDEEEEFMMPREGISEEEILYGNGTALPRGLLDPLPERIFHRGYLPQMYKPGETVEFEISGTQYLVGVNRYGQPAGFVRLEPYETVAADNAKYAHEAANMRILMNEEGRKLCGTSLF